MKIPVLRPGNPRVSEVQDEGGITIGSVVTIAIAAVLIPVALLIVMSILADTLPDTFTAIGDVNGVFTDNASDLNSSIGEAIAPQFPTLIVVILLFGLLGIVFFAVNKVLPGGLEGVFRRGGGGGGL